jgi:hypothetical protein
LTSSLPQALILTVERLYILEDESSRPHWQDVVEYDQWFDLFHTFTATFSKQRLTVAAHRQYEWSRFNHFINIHM